MASQLPHGCSYKQGIDLKLHVLSSYPNDQQTASIAEGEVRITQPNPLYPQYSAGHLKADFLSCLSAFLEPDDLHLAFTLLDQGAGSLTHVTESECGVHSQVESLANLRISPQLPKQITQGIDPAVAARFEHVLSSLISAVPDTIIPKIQVLRAILQEERVPVPVTSKEVSLSITSGELAAKTDIIAAHIQHPFPPFAMSATMKVLVQGQTLPAILKLFDRRFCTKVRTTDSVALWTPKRESVYHDFIHAGEAEKFTTWLNNADASSESSSISGPSWTIGHEETFLQDQFHDLFQSELAVYTALSSLQGHCIPSLLATVMLQPFPEATAEVQKYTTTYGLLLSYIPGIALDDVPHPQWRRVCDDAARAVKACNDLGVLLEDVRPENYVVQCTMKVGGTEDVIYRPYIVDFGMARCERAREENVEWEAKTKSINAEGNMAGCKILKSESESSGGGFIYKGYGRRQETQNEMPVEFLARSPGDEGEGFDMRHEEKVFRGRAESPLHPQAYLVDAHDDLNSDHEELENEDALGGPDDASD